MTDALRIMDLDSITLKLNQLFGERVNFADFWLIRRRILFSTIPSVQNFIFRYV